jgi:hypothetical protein
MRHWKSRLIGFLTCFFIGLALSLTVSFIASLFSSHHETATRRELSGQNTCGASESFSSPEEILAALKNKDVLIRREIFRRLFLRPGVATIYYDYERDRDYPERAERAELKYVNLDDQGGDEAVLTFLRYASPLALILKKEECGWRLVGALGAWLRFEDYPYQDWLELPETVKRGVHEILLRESTGDATRYMRHARLLKLTGGALTEVAEFTEENIKPVEGYRKADWNDVKLRESTEHTFLLNERIARLRLSTKEEVVIYSGALPSFTFWLETDGAWHNAEKHWRERQVVYLRSVSEHARELVWDEEQKRFIDAE